MEHDREPGRWKPVWKVAANGFGRCKMNRGKGLLVVEPCSHVTETRVI
ncbi:MAG: hypothetical protein KHZ72_11045 [Lachnospiraceae bacterium]|nr:hypothetical protein [Lachnospiraceae bacterium]